MMRLGAAFIAICMVLIAGSLGAILYFSAALSGVEASVVAIALLTVLVVYNGVAMRVHDNDTLGQQLADLSRGTADLARQVGDIGRRLEAAEAAGLAAADKGARAATAPLAAEIETLGNLVKQIAESVAAHEAMLAGSTVNGRLTAHDAARAAGHDAAPAATAVPAADPAHGDELDEPERSASRRSRGLDRAQVIAVVAAAIGANRVDPYLQPIVSLPQRRVRFYEASVRLRMEDGEVLSPAEFTPFAEAGGLMPKLDNLILFRCVQLLRRLAAKNREIDIFCDISAATLSDPEFFPQISDFMQANRALAPSLVLEFAQSMLRTRGPIENERLAALAEMGYRFSLDRLTDLRVAPRELADSGFRFVKASATLLLNRATTQATDIHPADFSDLLGRFGIGLIADSIENEATVVDLLDYDVRFGQGLLFSPPRPVRAEALGLTERGEAVRADAAPRAETALRNETARPETALRDETARPEPVRSEGARRESPTAAPHLPGTPSPAPAGATSDRLPPPPLAHHSVAGERSDGRAGLLEQLARGGVRRA